VTTWEFGSTGANIDGLPTAMIDALGMRTEYTYTTLRQIETITTDVGGSGHDNAVQTNVYNADDQLEREYGPFWDPADYTSTQNDDEHFFTEYIYDGLGRVSEIIGVDADGDGTGRMALSAPPVLNSSRSMVHSSAATEVRVWCRSPRGRESR
jgi:YD repeat-containing protein